MAVEHRVHGQRRARGAAQQAHGHHAPANRQRAHVALQVRRADEVDHHIHALAVRGLGDHGREVLGAVIDHHIGAKAAHGLALVAAGGGKHARAQGMGQLHRRRAHAARRRMDQHRFAGLQPCQMAQRFVRGHEHFGHRARIDQAQARGNRHRHAVIDARDLRVGAAADNAHHPVAHGEALHFGADFDHRARDLQAQRVAVAKVGAAISALALQQVGAVDAYRGIAHQQIMGAHFGQRDLAAEQHFGAAEIVKNNGSHGLLLRSGGGVQIDGHMRLS